MKNALTVLATHVYNRCSPATCGTMCPKLNVRNKGMKVRSEGKYVPYSPRTLNVFCNSKSGAVFPLRPLLIRDGAFTPFILIRSIQKSRVPRYLAREPERIIFSSPSPSYLLPRNFIYEHGTCQQLLDTH